MLNQVAALQQSGQWNAVEKTVQTQDKDVTFDHDQTGHLTSINIQGHSMAPFGDSTANYQEQINVDQQVEARQSSFIGNPPPTLINLKDS